MTTRSDATDNPRVEAAIWYAQQQFGVFPVWSPNLDGSCSCPAGVACKQSGKHPIPANGFKSATRDEAKIRTFLAAPSEPNIGVTPPPGTFGWDVDGTVPLKLAELAQRLGPLPPTLTTITANGKHLIFVWPLGFERPKGHPFGIVTRWTDTGYLIGAGSRHASGAIYRFEHGEDGNPRPIAELPAAWVQALLAYREPTTVPGQPGAKIGEGGRHNFLRDSARMFRGKGLTGDALCEAVWALNSERCSPPKTADEVRRAIGEVETKFGPDPAAAGQDPVVLPSPSEPMRIASQLVEDLFGGRHEGLILRHWRGEFWSWQTSHWLGVEDRALQSQAYLYTENAVFEKVTKSGSTLEPWAPNRYKTADLLDALRAVTHLSEKIDMPVWLDDRDHPPAGRLVACANGLLDISTRTLLGHDRAFFNRVAVPFPYQADALAPTRWLTFLDELWPDDPEAIEALAEFMGYVISGRRDLHKILLLVGPTRAGKGVIARVLKALVGRGNYAGPTLASLGTNFGLSPLIGKPLAIISDARLGGASVHQVVERLLSVSGEDMLTVDIKFKEPWTGTLPTRFLVISNELPRFGDASGAIAGRFLVLTLHRSWLGHENPALTEELLTELPGILSWVLNGLARLNVRGRFTEPGSSRDAVVALADLVSPTGAFVRERCEVGPASEVPCDELYAAWKSWAEDNGHRPGSSSSFGRDLRAVLPSVRTVRPRDDDRQRLYRGLRLSSDRNGPVHGPSWTSPSSEPIPPASGPVVQDGPRDQPLWAAGDEPSATVHCDHYRDHQSIHRWAGDRWVCPACNPDDDGGEPDSAKREALRESQDLGDWFEAPLPQPDAAPDGWGTLG